MGLEEILYLRFGNTLLEPVWNRNYVESRADHDGRELRRRGPRSLLRPGRRAARRRGQPPHAGGRGRGDGAARRRRRRDAEGRADHLVPRRAARPTRSTTCAVSTTATSRSTASRPTPPPRRSPRCDSRSRTGAGSACRSSSAPASGSRSPRPRCASCSSGRRGSGSGSATRESQPDQIVIRLDPDTGIRFELEARQAGRTVGATDPARHGVQGPGRRGRDALRGAAARGDERARPCASPVRTPSRRSGA